MRTIISGGTILTPERTLMGHTLVIDGERIFDLSEQPVPSRPGDLLIRIPGWTIVPGFIDVHVHGAQGADAMDAAPEALLGMGKYLAQHGVTGFCPTTMAAPDDAIGVVIEAFEALGAYPGSARALGLHLEGPYLNPQYRGAQPAQYLRAANVQEYGPWIRSGSVRLMTVAPEVEGVSDLIRAGVALGVEFAAGHSAASYEQTLAAADLGLRQSTHTFNGMPRLHHREPGLVGAILRDERIRAQIIADGIHVHPAMIRLLIQVKGTDRTVLITDATRAAGMPDGEYLLGSEVIHVNGGVSRTEDASLAGSTLSMDQALRNVMEHAELSLRDALPMATQTPAAALGLAHRKGSIRAGYDADLVILDGANCVQLTMVEGQVVYDAPRG
ncbi:MAG TPA: N-acetylglucosamine-6-phosphate deacetylase [Anaerolineales bacterium]|nr:N-acetylglucosamine-6-phosphate deacetylase [Anaerolineales bacterium]